MTEDGYALLHREIRLYLEAWAIAKEPAAKTRSRRRQRGFPDATRAGAVARSLHDSVPSGSTHHRPPVDRDGMRGDEEGRSP